MNRLIGEGTQVAYHELINKLDDGEVIVAAWLRDPQNTPHARPVEDANDHQAIVGKTSAGYYVQLRWFASKSGSTNPAEYRAD